MEWIHMLEIAVAFVTIIAAIYGAIQFIDWRISKKIHEESFLHKISSSLRPIVIFDENGSILLDQGGMDVIDKIEVSRLEGENFPERVTIFPKKHLAHPPILQTLENELIDIEEIRGKGYQWTYRLKYQMYDDVFTGKRRFRLEVLL